MLKPSSADRKENRFSTKLQKQNNVVSDLLRPFDKSPNHTNIVETFKLCCIVLSLDKENINPHLDYSADIMFRTD